MSELETLADTGNGRAQTKARNILEFFYGYEFDMEIPVPEAGGGSEEKSLSSSISANQNRVEKITLY